MWLEDLQYLLAVLEDGNKNGVSKSLGAWSEVIQGNRKKRRHNQETGAKYKGKRRETRTQNRKMRTSSLSKTQNPNESATKQRRKNTPGRREDYKLWGKSLFGERRSEEGSRAA